MPPSPLPPSASRLPSPLTANTVLQAATSDVIDFSRVERSGHGHDRWRTVGERVLTIALCCATAPLMLIAAALVKVTSRGPVFHRRLVLGHHGVPFHAFKFRTMVADADDQLHQDARLKQQYEISFKLAADPRVTPIGRVLRQSSLDELPQLFNVLRGEMSLVGPRIISPPELVRYGSDAERLLSVRPGITGLWQVSGRQLTSYDERVRLDMQYVQRRSIWLDLQILARTLPVVLSRRGAL
jgi:lipopolysaccharide/colanic/teichoic acid biosynthesis glycosyltransferase